MQIHLKNKDRLGILTKLKGKGLTFCNLNVHPNYADINLQITNINIHSSSHMINLYFLFAKLFQLSVWINPLLIL